MEGLEHVVFCIDNSAWSRNGDYRPTRLDAQLDSIYDFYPVFLDANPENTMGIITMGGNRVTVQTSLTRERYKLGTSMKQLERKGECDLYRGLAMAQLVLKHRENTNGKTRIIAFVGSPIKDNPKLLKLALMLSKDQIAVDILSFGEMEENHEILSNLISQVNLDDNSHLYEVPSHQSFNDIILPARTGNGFDDDDALDPELRRVLEESMRTYQQETGQAVSPVVTDAKDTSGKSNEMEELKAVFEGEDVDEEYMADLRAAMLESLQESQNNDKEKKDDNKDIDSCVCKQIRMNGNLVLFNYPFEMLHTRASSDESSEKADSSLGTYNQV